MSIVNLLTGVFSMTISTEKMTIEQLREFKGQLEDDLRLAEMKSAIVKNISESTGFPYAVFEVFGAIHDGVTILSEDLTILWANAKAVEQISERKGTKKIMLADLIGQHCYENYGMSTPCPVCVCLKAMKSKKTQIDMDYRVSSTNGSYELLAIPIYNGTTACILITRNLAKPEADEGKQDG